MWEISFRTDKNIGEKCQKYKSEVSEILIEPSLARMEMNSRIALV